MYKHQKIQIIKFPIHLIEEKFGAGNFDNAGDAILAILKNLIKKSDYSVQWSFDNSHTNSWYHTFNLTIQGLSDNEFMQLTGEVKRIGILEDK